MPGEPEYRFVRKEKYNPNFEDYFREEFPTNTIKRAGRIKFVNICTLIASHAIGACTYLVVTRL